MDQGWVAKVVQAITAEDLRAGLEPDGLCELDAILCQNLWGEDAQRTQEGPAGMNDLDLAVPAGAISLLNEFGLVANTSKANLADKALHARSRLTGS